MRKNSAKPSTKIRMSAVKPVTMRDVARYAGVSVATVSRALDGSQLVTKKTVQLVQSAADVLNFVPNNSARTLKYGQSRVIGVVIPDLTNPFFSEFLREFEAIVSASGEVVLLASAESSTHGPQNSVRQMLMRGVDGVVVMSSIDELDPRQLLKMRKVPTVAIDSRRVGSYFSDVSMMHEEGMLQAVGYLKEMGHRRIAFIAGSQGLFISDLRLQAFRRALQQYGMAVPDEYIRTGNYRADAGDREMRELMALRHRPTAVVAINDMSALGALRAAQALSMAVPEDVSIIGFDGIALDEVVTPALTSMSVCRKELAASCHRALTELRVFPQQGGKLLQVPVKLVVRQSTGRAPAKPRRGLA